MTIKITLKQY